LKQGGVGKSKVAVTVEVKLSQGSKRKMEVDSSSRMLSEDAERKETALRNYVGKGLL